MEMISDNLMGIIIVISLCVVLPIVIVLLVMRTKKNETDKRTQIILAALEKNPNVDTNELVKMMTATPKKSVKKKLMDKLLDGCIMVFIGLALILQAIFMSMDAGWKGINYGSITGGVICLGIGIAFLINYFIGKRFLAKEIEREENNLPEKE